MTPHILLHSGIGPQHELEALGIESKVNLPGVGKNLTDHPSLPNSFIVSNNDTRDPYYWNETLREELLAEWLTEGTGEYMVDSVLGHIGFFHLDSDNDVFQLADDPAAGPGAAHWELITNVSARNVTIVRHTLTGIYFRMAVALRRRRVIGAVTSALSLCSLRLPLEVQSPYSLRTPLNLLSLTLLFLRQTLTGL
jgi:choline dehydrogenase-like flavoprotein